MKICKRPVPVWILAALLMLGGGLVLAQAPGDGAAPAGAPAAGADQGGAAPAAPGQGDTEVQKTEKMSFLELLAKGRWFMLPIGFCSLLGLAIIFERLVALRRKKIMPPTLMTDLREIFQKSDGDHRQALQYCRNHPSPMARVIAPGIRKMPSGVEAVEQAIEDAGANEVSKLRRNLRMLYGTANVAPMLGLLGTVWGMIEAFQVASTQGLGRAEKLAEGIYEALVTTFAGLCVAIPILIFYYYFLSKIDSLVTDMNDQSEEFIEKMVE